MTIASAVVLGLASAAFGDGACCLPDGSCEITSIGDCGGVFAGLFAGAGTTCLDVVCAQPGACCLPTGDCIQTERTGGEFDVGGTCADLGGYYHGDGSDCGAAPCLEPGWNWIDNEILLTKNEPSWWSAATGLPKGVSPFVVLDPADAGPPGRPDPEGSGDRVLRGFIVAWAVDAEGREIRWNHLGGRVTVVDYRQPTAWEHTAWSFPAVSPVANGEATGDPGVLRLDGEEYVRVYDQLVVDFWAAGSMTLGGITATLDLDLTLMPLDLDLRQESLGPTTTKAVFTLWNQNEVKFSGLDRCITCWDEARVSLYGWPNHFLQEHLQTSKGRARIDARGSRHCDQDNDPTDGRPVGQMPGDVLSTDTPLLGVAAKVIGFADDAERLAGTNLHGMGTQTAVIRHDVLGAPPEAVAGAGGADPRDALSVTAPVSLRTKPADSGAAAAPDRVSGSEKGSLLLFPKIELRWDAEGQLVVDTFIALTNDFPEDVRVQMYFVNGDGVISDESLVISH